MAVERTLTEMLGLDDRSIERLVARSTEAIFKAWTDLAPTPAYKKALSMSVDSRGGHVKLSGPAVFVERGVAARDMREPLLASPKAKVSADGHRYRTIPMGKGADKHLVTVSDKGRPWMRHGKPGSKCIVRIHKYMPEILATVWANRERT